MKYHWNWVKNAFIFTLITVLLTSTHSAKLIFVSSQVQWKMIVLIIFLWLQDKLNFICSIIINHHYADLIENIQQKFTKFLSWFFHIGYLERLQILKINTLEERRIYVDLVMVFKIYHELVDINFDDYFKLNSGRTREAIHWSYRWRCPA